MEAQRIEIRGPWRYVGIAVLVVISFFIVRFLAALLAPVLAALGVAYLLNPSVMWLENRGMSRSVASFMVLTLLAIIVPLGIVLAAPRVVSDLWELATHIPEWLTQGATFMNDRFGLTLPTEFSAPENVNSIVEKVLGPVSDIALAAIGGVFSLLGALAELLVVPVFAYYFLIDWRNILDRILHTIPPRKRLQATELGREVNVIIAGWVRGQSTVVVILAVVYSIGYQIAGLQFAVPIGILAGVLTVIPYVGPIFGAGIAVILAFTQGASVDLLVGVGIVIAFGQILESFFLTPKIVGHSVGLSESAALFAVIAGGKVFGFVGILLAVPIAATTKVLLRMAYDKYEHSKFYGTEQDADIPVTAAMAAVNLPSAHEQHHIDEDKPHTP